MKIHQALFTQALALSLALAPTVSYAQTVNPQIGVLSQQIEASKNSIREKNQKIIALNAILAEYKSPEKKFLSGDLNSIYYVASGIVVAAGGAYIFNRQEWKESDLLTSQNPFLKKSTEIADQALNIIQPQTQLITKHGYMGPLAGIDELAVTVEKRKDAVKELVELSKHYSPQEIKNAAAIISTAGDDYGFAVLRKSLGTYSESALSKAVSRARFRAQSVTKTGYALWLIGGATIVAALTRDLLFPGQKSEADSLLAQLDESHRTSAESALQSLKEMEQTHHDDELKSQLEIYALQSVKLAIEYKSEMTELAKNEKALESLKSADQSQK